MESLRFASSFVGREQEATELIDAVKRHRLVTVVGIGGMGKSRLADFAARRVSDIFADGAFFVELARASVLPGSAAAPSTRDRWFESISLHRRVSCEPDFRPGGQHHARGKLARNNRSTRLSGTPSKLSRRP
jgi:hypothetical protein